MHRSGTTMLTKMLEKLGLFIGEEKEKNYESLYFQRINRWMLAQSNTTWDFPENFRYINAHYRKNVVRAVNWNLSTLKRKQYLGWMNTLKYKSIHSINFPWGWKDPVNSITLPIWKEIFPEAFIINIYRNPIDVSRSLKERELRIEKRFKVTQKVKWHEFFLNRKFLYNQSYFVTDMSNGVKLWSEYIRLNLEHEKKYSDKFLTIRYEDFLDNPLAHIKKVADFIQLPVTENILEQSIANVDNSRKYSFLDENESVQLYKKIQNDPLLIQLGYSNIVRNVR